MTGHLDRRPARPEPGRGGPIAWMVRHRVAPNLLMLVLLVGGLLMSSQIRQEVFPEFAPDRVEVQIAYPGASPDEVERGVVLVTEEAIRGIEDVSEVTATASEGRGVVRAEVRDGGDFTQVYQDIKQAVDRVTTYPDDAEAPRVSASENKRQVMDVLVHGPVDFATLRAAAEAVRARFLAADGITRADLADAPAPEIAVVVPEDRLRAHDLTRSELAEAIRRSALDRGLGVAETPTGEVVLRLKQRREQAAAYAQTPIITTAEGARLTLGDLAAVRDGFEDGSPRGFFDGQPALGVRVFRVGDQTPVGVSEAVRSRLSEVRDALPDGVSATIVEDRSEVYAQRVDLLLRNGLLGLLLVLGLLSLFLDIRLAFWVTVGIPTVFVGVLILLPLLGVSLNMISLFAFLLGLGIVVDDAIVAGENIYEHRQRGESLIGSAIVGARDISVPIGFSILTNAAAFAPLWFVPGAIGALWAVFPAVVVSALAISWIEALFILPSHLAHTRAGGAGGGRLARIETMQAAFAARLQAFVDRVYGPALRRAMRWRYATIAAAVGLLVVTLALPLSGRMPFVFLPRVGADVVTVQATLPAGAPDAAASALRARLVSAGRSVSASTDPAAATGIYAIERAAEVEVRAFLPDPDVRTLEAGAFARAWRARAGSLPQADVVRYSSQAGPGAGPSLTVEVAHPETNALETAAARVAEALRGYDGVSDVDDGVAGGKRQIDLSLTPAGRALGLDGDALARQVRAAIQGVEAVRQQVGRDEVTVRVEAPAAETAGLADFRRLRVRTPEGGSVSLGQVARLEKGAAYDQISRRDGRRIVEVTARVTPQDRVPAVTERLRGDVLAELSASDPRLTVGFGGRQSDRNESLSSFATTVPMALFGIFALLAIPLRSYLQPAIVLAAIPFGIVGAILGHLVMGYSLSIISVMGIIALSGVVVNGSLVMLTYANRKRGEGASPFEAAHMSGVRRFRPILLTTLTTFGGLTPMIFETSMQARFLIPMALSLGFGILVATGILLFLTPCLYMTVEDAKAVWQRGRATLTGRAERA